jgi:hypothetical protein
MAISGLVVTIVEGPAGGSALAALAADPRVTVGERFDRRVAVLAETPGARDDYSLIDDLLAIPGVVSVDIACVHLDETPAAGPGHPPQPSGTTP